MNEEQYLFEALPPVIAEWEEVFKDEPEIPRALVFQLLATRDLRIRELEAQLEVSSHG